MIRSDPKINQSTAQVESPNPAPRLAASSYLNTAPLIWSFLEGAQSQRVQLLTDAAPSRCADLLAQHTVDAALVPVIEYQRIPELAVVPGVCVGSRGRVRSVVLVTREDVQLKDVQSVALDIQSRTSAALIQVIFREFLNRSPQYSNFSPSLPAMLEEHDAALLIGDPAMTFPRERLRVYDLAALWREYTNLGFVFAMWMARKSAGGAVPESVRAVDFAGARDEGLAHANEIAARYEKMLNLPAAELHSYLTKNICFTLNEEMQEGLALFYRLAYRHGIIPAERPLELIA